MTDTPPPAPPKTFKLKSGVTLNLEAKEFEGKLQSITYKSLKGPFKILKIGGVTCKGKMDEPQVGTLYKLEGKYEKNDKYNTYDFAFTSYSGTMDSTAGLVEYLVREARGIGGAAAANIVRAFGNNAINVMADAPDRLKEIPGLSYETRQRLSDWAKGERSNAKTKEKLYGLGLLPALVGKLMRAFGNNAEQKIKEDCYALSQIDGIGFRTVALVADALGIAADDPGRVKAGILHQIETMLEDGHTCIHRNELIRESCNLLSITHDKVNIQLDELLEDRLLIDDSMPFEQYAAEEGLNFDAVTK